MELWCYSNKLTSLNISENTNLKTVWCYANKLTALDLSKSKGLDYLKCNDNYLEEINANVSNKSINISAVPSIAGITSGSAIRNQQIQ